MEANQSLCGLPLVPGCQGTDVQGTEVTRGRADLDLHLSPTTPKVTERSKGL